jgi:hypothetical protein
MTLQQRDIITYNGKKYSLNRDIMKPFFLTNLDKKPEKSGFDSTLHRGYFSQYELIDNRLLLTDLRVYVDFDKHTSEKISTSVMNSAVGSVRFCSWFSGTLVLNSLTIDGDNNYHYLSLKINDGKVEEVVHLTQLEFREMSDYAHDYF